MRFVRLIVGAGMIAALVLCGCRRADPTAQFTLPSGTSLDVVLGTGLSSESSEVGDVWSGSIRNALVLHGRNAIPIGSTAAGTVSSVTPARNGTHAMIGLDLTSITVGDRDYRVHGSTAAVIAGSPRARDLNAVAGSTVIGARIGNAMGVNDAAASGLAGAGVATGVVTGFRGSQVVLREGTPLTFTTHQAVAVRLQ
jgi:hypothetical protein